MLKHNKARVLPVVLSTKPDGTVAAKQLENGANAHVHGPGCSHDHAGHDHHGHDHDGHDHDGHGHHGHDHHGHDHHDHDHDHPHVERPHGTRAAEDGGTALQLDLEAILPGETDEIGRFEKLEELLRAHRAVKDAHIRRDGTHAELCLHYEASLGTVEELLQLARASGKTAAKRYLAKTWFVRGMDSAQCATVIEYALARTKGVLEANVAYAAERLVVEFDKELVSPAALEKKVDALGYALETPEPGHACSHHGHGGGLSPKLELPLSAAAGALLAIGWILQRFQVVGPTVATVLFGLAIASGGLFAARGAVQSLRQLRVDIETLTVLAAFGAAFLGAWFEGAFLLFLFSLGHAIEHRAMERARRAVDALGKLRPATARVRRSADVLEIPVSQVKRGDRIVVRPGDRVPLDGVIREGRSALEQAAITGESIPVAKGPGDEVFCGTINTEAALEVEVTRLSGESVLARVVDLVVEAEARKSPAQRFASGVERRFVPVVLVLAVALPVVLVALGFEAKEALLRAVSLLVAASPCALAISVPAAVLSAVAAAARGGVLMKGGAHLEALGNVHAVAFDKTGTLTEGRPKLVSTLAVGVSEAELLAVAAGAEQLSAHPLAKAVVEGARAKGIEPLAASGLEAVHGKGLRATVAGQPVVIGNLAIFQGNSVPAEVTQEVDRQELQGRTTVVVRRGDAFVGVLGIADTARAESKDALARLKALGVSRTVMLSGDNVRVARGVADALGIDHVHAPLLPEGKVHALKTLAKGGGVAMVGDGVNDAPALAAASVGVAMGGAGSDVALETADVVLMGDDLRKLPFAVGLARRASRTIRQNLVISIGLAGVLIVSSIFGLTQVSEAVVLHEGGTLLVIANGLMLLRVKPE